MGSDFFLSVTFWGKQILTPYSQPMGMLPLAGGPGKGKCTLMKDPRQ